MFVLTRRLNLKNKKAMNREAKAFSVKDQLTLIRYLKKRGMPLPYRRVLLSQELSPSQTGFPRQNPYLVVISSDKFLTDHPVLKLYCKYFTFNATQSYLSIFFISYQVNNSLTYYSKILVTVWRKQLLIR